MYRPCSPACSPPSDQESFHGSLASPPYDARCYDLIPYKYIPFSPAFSPPSDQESASSRPAWIYNLSPYGYTPLSTDDSREFVRVPTPNLPCFCKMTTPWGTIMADSPTSPPYDPFGTNPRRPTPPPTIRFSYDVCLCKMSVSPSSTTLDSDEEESVRNDEPNPPSSSVMEYIELDSEESPLDLSVKPLDLSANR